MRLFGRKREDQPTDAATVLAEAPGSPDDPVAELGRLQAGPRSRDAERRALRLRHGDGIRLGEEAAEAAAYPPPEEARLPAGPGLPEIAAADVTPGLVRAGILRDGFLLVRGLVDRDAALGLAAEIDRAFAAREAALSGGTPDAGYYEEFEPEPGFDVSAVRPWIRDGGGVLAADSPRVLWDVLDAFAAAGITDLVRGYLGEPALVSVHKTTLRRAEPTVGGSWHQDGAFMGPVRALNLWLALSRCGDVAPGMDLVPRRLDRVVVEEKEMFSPDLTRRKAEAAAGDVPIVRPVFEPGDALLFDELFLHSTASDPSMPNPRFAIESWFFGASGFPRDYAPLAV